MSHDQDMLDLIRWASQFGCTVSVNGEIGFGRPCVGVLCGSSYVALGPQEKFPADGHGQPEIWFATCIPEAAPPIGVDAYHKDDYFAVLGTGPEAEAQLVTWWKSILEKGEIGIKVGPTQNRDPLQLLFSGATYAHLCPLADIPTSAGGTGAERPLRTVDDRPADCPISRVTPGECGFMSDPPYCTPSVCSRNLNQEGGR